jgi:hypothetical protein
MEVFFYFVRDFLEDKKSRSSARKTVHIIGYVPRETHYCNLFIILNINSFIFPGRFYPFIDHEGPEGE